MANPSVNFQSGISGAERFLRLPGRILSAKWCEFPRVDSSSRLAVGPSEGYNDTVFLAVLELVPSTWPAWEKAMDSVSGIDVYYLAEEYAAGLLPPAWLDAIPPDANGRDRRLTGEMFDPSPIATSRYGGVVAIKHGDYLFIELGSK